jgi:tRNA (guanine-N7-)-methyltransferase
MSLASPPDLRPWFLTLEDLPAPPLDWKTLFGTDQPVEVEIGSGRGLFLFNTSLSRPDTNFLGIEYDFKEARRAATRLHKRKIPNARMLGADARIALPKFITTGSVDAVHVYFPDPWWKRRHSKRRIFEPIFVAEAARLLRVGGRLHAWTDVPEYFEIMLQVVAGQPAFAALPPPDERAPEHDMDYHTSFERKKRKAGLPIHRARWERLNQPVAPPAPDVEIAKMTLPKPPAALSGRNNKG